MIANSGRIPAPVPPLTTLPDGTIKQVNPFSGTEVWTVPGRGHRPMELYQLAKEPIADRDRASDFGIARKLDTPPEKARMVRDINGEVRIDRGVVASKLEDSEPLFRRSTLR